jgi:hypothetical protein
MVKDKKKKLLKNGRLAIGQAECRHLASYRQARRDLRKHMAERMYVYNPQTIPEKFLKNGFLTRKNLSQKLKK